MTKPRKRRKTQFEPLRGRILFIFIALVILSGFCYIYFFSPDSSTYTKLTSMTAGVGGAISLADVRADYGGSIPAQKVRILIVPGHEPNYGGAQFGSLDERNLVVEIGQDLQQYLQTNSNYQVFITRDTQAWNPTFVNYFSTNWSAITTWEAAHLAGQSSVAALGAEAAPPEIHITDPTDVALRLYGITKWANENSIDLMIHLHLNDYPGHPNGVAGKYSGLVMYIPAQQYANSTTTKAIADAVFKRLSLYNPISNLPIESSGLIDDPELIAVGANNTADAASMLIEYDYIYEPQLVNPAVRSLALKDFAYQTYLGLQDFFNQNTNVTAVSSYNPESLYAWNTPVTGKSSNPEDIYAVQTALIMDGDYPPAGMTKNDCPHSGTLGTCTEKAVAAFQSKNGITGEGIGGSQTFNLLQKIYNQNK